MIDLIALSAAKKHADLLAMGLTSVSVDNTNKSITFTLTADGSQRTIYFDQPSDGISIVGIEIKNGHLICLMSDGSEIDAGVLPSGGSGGSVPKPLTYDYMPEGYPSKSIQTVTLMEEQEVAFSDMDGVMAAILPVGELQDGQQLTVIWDNVSYSTTVTIFNGSFPVFGNLGLAEFGPDTGEPFIYLDQGTGSELWGTTDPAQSHTIKVLSSVTIHETMSEAFIPKSAFIKAEWESIANRPFYIRSIDTDIVAENINATINVGNNIIDLLQTAPDFNDGLYYNVEGVISFHNIDAGIPYELTISGYYKANKGSYIYLGSVYDGACRSDLGVEYYGGNANRYSAGKLYVSGGHSCKYTISANFTVISELKQLPDDYIPDTIQRVGNGVAIPSSTIAEVGQTIVVKEVNEEGKPISWEMADLPSAVTDDHINSLIDAKLGVIENGSY